MKRALPPAAMDEEDPIVHAAAEGVAAASAELALADPFAGANLRARAALGLSTKPAELLGFWLTRARGNPTGQMRYRWELSHRHGVTLPRFAGASEEGWRAWRTAEQPNLEQDPYAFEERLATPIVLASNAELLSELGETGEQRALALLSEHAPVLRRDFAQHVQAIDPWRDTFALFVLARSPRTLTMLHPLAVAIAESYAALVPDSAVLGLRFPFHMKPLVSASAQLASGLLALASDLELVATLVDFVARARSDLGGWGDAGGAPDVLTTLVAADLLARVDPSFEAGPTRRFLARTHGADGLWRALGPEAVWLTSMVLEWLLAAAQPFARRFQWPHLPVHQRCHKTKLPTYAYFADLVSLFASLPGLSGAPLEIAFFDLVGFRAYNNRFGQNRGDEVLKELASALAELPGSCAIRDGGDEFLLLGAPTGHGLVDVLEQFRQTWPRRFEAAFGADVPPVAPRILFGHTRGRALATAREQLGVRITELKRQPSGAAGILVNAGELVPGDRREG